MQEILTKISTLKTRLVDADEDTKALITQWYKDAKKALLIEDLSTHPGMATIYLSMSAQVDEINSKLLNDRTLTEANRALLFQVRDIWEMFLGTFKAAKETIRSIENNVDSNLEEQNG
jgi:hypothetical protein